MFVEGKNQSNSKLWPSVPKVPAASLSLSSTPLFVVSSWHTHHFLAHVEELGLGRNQHSAIHLRKKKEKDAIIKTEKCESSPNLQR